MYALADHRAFVSPQFELLRTLMNRPIVDAVLGDPQFPSTVLILNSFCHAQGGASRVAIDEAVGLSESGFNVIFLGAVGPVCTELANSRVRVVCLEQSELALASSRPQVMLQGLWNRRAQSVVKEILGSLDPLRTVVHLHSFSQALSASPVRSVLDRGFVVICTLHDFFTACPNGGFFDFTLNEPCLRRAMSANCIATNCDRRNYAHKLYRVVRSKVQSRFGYLPGGVTNYISLSRRSAAILRPYLPREARVFEIENPVEVDKAPPIDVASNDAIVAVGRLDAEKGIGVLIEAAKSVGMKLTLIGDGPLRALAEDSGICTVTGWLARNAVSAAFRSARVLVFPSVWYETYGLAVAEAAGRGVPAIVSDICAAAERVQNDITGWHARAGDASDLARCLLLTRDDETVRRMGLAAYDQFWSSPPTRVNHIRSLVEAYAQILPGFNEGDWRR